MIEWLKRTFYLIGGPWWRCRLFELFGSQRYSQPALHGLDAALDELIGKEGGVFLEAGAHDGYTQSNTYFLERFRSWTGVLVEPIPDLAAKAKRRRPNSAVLSAAVVGPSYDADTVPIVFGDLMSTMGDPTAAEEHVRNLKVDSYRVDAPARTLNQILDEAGVTAVDLMVLDLEGHEMEALRGIDFDEHPVEWLVLEILDLPAQRAEFDALLEAHFEPRGELSEWDALYRRRSDSRSSADVAS